MDDFGNKIGFGNGFTWWRNNTWEAECAFLYDGLMWDSYILRHGK